MPVFEQTVVNGTSFVGQYWILWAHVFQKGDGERLICSTRRQVRNSVNSYCSLPVK